jgi:predicted LPLAT superfamily acyltransferase
MSNSSNTKNNEQTAANDDSHWSSAQEAGTLFGLRFLWLIHKTLGRKAVSILLLPTVAYFVIFRADSRKASQEFLKNHYQQYPDFWKRKPKFSDTIRHFRQFAETVVDKLSSWYVELDSDLFKIHSPEVVETLLNDTRGQLIIGSHFGNLEFCRGFMHRYKDKSINVLLHDKHSQNYTNIMAQLNPDSRLNVYQVDEFNINTILSFKEKIDAGEWLFIAGDRIPLTGVERTVTVDFFNKKAALPIGPYLLAKALDCPVKLMFSYQDFADKSGQIQFEVVDFAEKIVLSRKQRQSDIENYAQRFATELEKQCAKAPFQWFNFYDFWLPEENTQEQINTIANKEVA